jgi:hypothetical protein
MAAGVDRRQPKAVGEAIERQGARQRDDVAAINKAAAKAASSPA